MKHETITLDMLRDTIVGSVRADTPDLTARQLAILLICTVEDHGGHTVRDLASRLKAPKPSITRALDRLEEFDLVRRADDKRDRRSILAVVTPSGQRLVDELEKLMTQSTRASRMAAAG